MHILHQRYPACLSPHYNNSLTIAQLPDAITSALVLGREVGQLVGSAWFDGRGTGRPSTGTYFTMFVSVSATGGMKSVE